MDRRGRVLVTRWSGRFHTVERDGSVRHVTLPRLTPDALYYTGVRVGDRVCATHCGGIRVVCQNLE